MWPVIVILMEGLKFCETEVTTWNRHHPNTFPCTHHTVQAKLVFIYDGYILFSTPPPILSLPPHS